MSKHDERGDRLRKIGSEFDGLRRNSLKRSRVSTKTIADFERGQRAPYDRTLADIQRAPEGAGIEFLSNDRGERRREVEASREGPKQINTVALRTTIHGIVCALEMVTPAAHDRE